MDGCSVLLTEQFCIALGVEAYDEGVTGSKCGRSQRAAAAQNGRRECVVGGALAQVEFQQPLALRDPDLLGLAGMGEGLLTGNLHLVGDDELGLGDVLGSQELLGALAARSRLAVVVPGDHLGLPHRGSGSYRMCGQVCGAEVVASRPHALRSASTMGRAHSMPGR